MKTIDFNENWKCGLVGANQKKSVCLPHDAMIFEKRTMKSDGGTNIGWYDAHNYEYEKTFVPDEKYRNKLHVLEFEGVYHNAYVYLNDEELAFHPYGYTNFYVDITQKLRWGTENKLSVIAENAKQPNSRWYTGTGIYRPVRLHLLDGEHIELNGIKITTLSIDPAVVEIKVRTNAGGKIKVEILDGDSVIASHCTDIADNAATVVFRLENVTVWSPESPYLYNCRVTYGEDVRTEKFGIRTIAVSHADGFTLNGKRVVLRGACIHHDNGILGARCYPEAEERKVRLLKENGYNAIRSAHNPCSKALLDACDRLGMLVMDEYVDMWYIHKTMYDYADYVMDWFERDITDIIDKDYNHPSVIMYSYGNEVAETGQKKGIEFFKTMRNLSKKLDPSRPVTVGVNIFFNYLSAMGLGVYDDKKARENPQKKVGSEFFNNLAGLFGDKFMKTMALLPGCDKKTRDCYAAMDVAGYNYGIKRYKGDLKKYPDRLILGSETFCSDAYEFWERAKTDNALIGDFVWTGIDYLGELGIGAWEYREYAPSFFHDDSWVAAGSGRLDLIGTPWGEALYTKVAFDLEDKPQIAVVPVNHTKEKHSPSAWRFSNAIPSWSWNGLDGKKAKVEVYSKAPVVELYVNGEKVGKKKFRKNCCFNFSVIYKGGKIEAVAKDKDGKELSRNSLVTAGEETILAVIPEKRKVSAGEVCFVNVAYTDSLGTVKPLCHKDIEIKVEGSELLAFGNGCPVNKNGFNDTKTFTYYGRAMAVIKAGKTDVKVTVSDGTLTGEAVIKV